MFHKGGESYDLQLSCNYFERFSVLFASLKNCLRGTFTTFGSTLRQLCKQPPGIRSGFCGIGFLKIAHFWWRMVCSQVICDQLEASYSYAKKDLRNGLFRQFYVDPCGVFFLLKSISMSESLSQKNVNAFLSISVSSFCRNCSFLVEDGMFPLDLRPVRGVLCKKGPQK